MDWAELSVWLRSVKLNFQFSASSFHLQLQGKTPNKPEADSHFVSHHLHKIAVTYMQIF